MFPCLDKAELVGAEVCVVLFVPLWSLFTENCENANGRNSGEPCWGGESGTAELQLSYKQYSGYSSLM